MGSRRPSKPRPRSAETPARADVRVTPGAEGPKVDGLRRRATRTALAVVGAVAVAVGVARVDWESWFTRGAAPPPSTGTAAGRASGDELYTTFCESCHGPNGRGDGVAAPLCRVPPADFTRAEFKVRSTATGSLPTDHDLRTVIRRGAGPDGAMPAFEMFEPSEVDRLVAKVKSFSPRWQSEPAPVEIALPRRRAADAARGAQVYQEWGCAACHGPTGAGDGPRARELRTSRGHPDPPTDFRRPWTFKAGRDEPDLARSILTGFNGTTMPGLQLPAGAADRLWDLASYLRSLQQPAPPAEPAPDTATARGYWTTPVPAQPGHLSAVTCASCHTAQFRDWSRTRHALALSPGVWAQMNDQPALSGNCVSCHAPLREQLTDGFLQSDGVSCSACHARGGQRFGPPVTTTTLAPLVAKFPSPHGATNVRDFFESSDFCARCHQFAEGEAPRVNGKFLENTVEEWKASRAAREGKTCQTCHMPDRRHLFRGIHDPDTVRAGVTWAFDVQRVGSRVESRMTLTNSDTGHAFPTYIVPEVWLRIEAVNRFGIGALVAEKLIGRQVTTEGGEWREQSDTRLRQDETATLVYGGALPSGTVAIAGSVIVRPDAYHVHSLAGHMRDTRSEQSRRLYQQALAEMGQSDYVLFREVRDLPR